MKLFIATDFRIYLKNERIFISNKAFTIIKRYHEAFGDIILCTRTTNKIPDASWYDATDILYKVIPMNSLKELYTSKFSDLMKSEIAECDLVVGRFESFTALKASKIARKLCKPFFAEIMSCAWDGLWNHSVIGKLVAPYAYFATKKAVKNADFALYVTEKFLQKRYPCKNKSANASNVVLKNINDDVFVRRLNKISTMNLNEITLMTTAATYVKYKGQQYVIKSIPELNQIGIRVKYLIVGEGDQTYLRHVAKKCNVEDQVVFTGKKTLDEVFAYVDETDIYIQPSLQEGLPRAMIEAMSRGCPCLGARTAGIPELVDFGCLVKRKSVKDIKSKLITNLDKNNMIKLAKTNFLKAMEFKDSVLKERRTEYFEYVKDCLIERKNDKDKIIL